MEEDNKTYLKYFIEIRKRLLHLFIVFCLGTTIGVIFYQNILHFVLHLFNFTGVNIIMSSPGQIIELAIQAGLTVGIFISFPFILKQLLDFLKPGLKQKEYHILNSLVPLALILYLIGFLFGGWITQIIISFFSSVSSQFNVNNIWDIQKFFNMILTTALLTGLIFEMPIVLTGLIRLNVVSPQYLSKQRKYVYAFLVIFAVLLPPTDIVSLCLITIPLIFLFEFSLLLNRRQPALKVSHTTTKEVNQ